MAKLVADIIKDACINSGVASTFGTDDIPTDVSAMAQNILENQILRQVSADPRLMLQEEVYPMTAYDSYHFSDNSEWQSTMDENLHYYGNLVPTTDSTATYTAYYAPVTQMTPYLVSAVIRDGRTLTRVSAADMITIYKGRLDVYAKAIATNNIEDKPISDDGSTLNADPIEVIYVWGPKKPTVVYNVPPYVTGGSSPVLMASPTITQYITDVLAMRMAATYSVATIDTCKAMCDMSLNACLRPVRKPMLKADPMAAMDNLMHPRSLK